jgi:hypothetical protein
VPSTAPSTAVKKTNLIVTPEIKTTSTHAYCTRLTLVPEIVVIFNIASNVLKTNDLCGNG